MNAQDKQEIRDLVRQILQEELSKMQITGPGFSGRGTQWTFNPNGTINATLDCATNKLTGTIDFK